MQLRGVELRREVRKTYVLVRGGTGKAFSVYGKVKRHIQIQDVSNVALSWSRDCT